MSEQGGRTTQYGRMMETGDVFDRKLGDFLRELIVRCSVEKNCVEPSFPPRPMHIAERQDIIRCRSIRLLNKD
jgi:hypothetical protein